jgi:hypothetical protein
MGRAVKISMGRAGAVRPVRGLSQGLSGDLAHRPVIAFGPCRTILSWPTSAQAKSQQSGVGQEILLWLAEPGT